MKRTVSVFLTVLLLLSLAVPAFAAGNVGYMSGVTEAMCSPDYWLKKQTNADLVLMTPAQTILPAAKARRTNPLNKAAKKRAMDC